ncbi:hypothetical protein BKA67DRAFT_530697 [Truncatella angustata]|uniref:Uncharacterized protein n=1 Tax=Truncatella angustata TaxID=152316 RepID=A0A9P8UZ12_9PEZI|nr:uncharacterized protein BKA67DRAFT_530697 [Truncatella angustata]KAH6660606.1 hypothetical protein BKA67DRAFT_530697 [Truncatella angustata]
MGEKKLSEEEEENRTHDNEDPTCELRTRRFSDIRDLVRIGYACAIIKTPGRPILGHPRVKLHHDIDPATDACRLDLRVNNVISNITLYTPLTHLSCQSEKHVLHFPRDTAAGRYISSIVGGQVGQNLIHTPLLTTNRKGPVSSSQLFQPKHCMNGLDGQQTCGMAQHITRTASSSDKPG